MTLPSPFLFTRVPFEIRYYEHVDLNGFDIQRSIVKHITKHYQLGCYFCCGQGNVGHQLLYSNQVDHMHFVDCYEPALRGCRETVDLHGWQADYSDHLPDQQFDLFVADPPWESKLLADQFMSEQKQRCFVDKDFSTHKQMFSWLADHLAKDGDAYITKIHGNDEFYDMIPSNMIIKNEHNITYFAPGPQRIRLITRARLLHLRFK